MRIKKIALLALPIAAAVLVFAYLPEKPVANAEANEGFAVVELFTSQGCSSCPSADAFLSRLIKRAEIENEQIIALSFHVDYWNRLGWKDPYSDRRFTERQQRYAQVFGNNTIYTPQMIVNGNKAFESSRQNVINKGVETALNMPAQFRIEMSDVKIEDNRLYFTINIDRPAKDLHLNLALVERGITTVINAGENGGKRLSHDNVVRSFATVALGDESKEKSSLPLPEGVNVKNASLVVYLQSAQSLKIHGAGQLQLDEFN